MSEIEENQKPSMVEELKKATTKDDVYKPNRKYPGFRKNLYDYFQEFTDNTTIHGCKYIGEQDRSWFEKIWWLILFCISFYVCIDLIIQTYRKWDTSPVIVSFARSPTPVWQVPFPAITICSVTKAKQRQYNFTKAFNDFHFGNNMTQEEIKLFEDSLLICGGNLNTSGEKTTNFSTIERLMSITPQLNDTLFACKWMLDNESCEHLFSPMLTQEGLCFTFNVLDKAELLRNNVFLHGDYLSHGRYADGWTLENGYPKNSRIDSYPRRAMPSGFSAGLNLVLAAQKEDFDYICSGAVQGFKILLHHPAEIPKVGMQYFWAPLNKEIVASVKPDMMTTSQGLRNYDPHRRQCFFSTEKYLAFFQNYTQQNCRVECLRNYTLARCKCVAYHMPHEESTPICGPGSLSCMFQAQTELLEREVTSGITSLDSNTKDKFDCDCLPACTSLTYNAELSQADFNWLKMFESFGISENIPGMQLTHVTLFFKEQQFITSERNELYGQTDFLANCGGILGLFTGFSVLSIVEIVYFLSLRLMCNVRMYGRRYWSGSSRLVNNDAYIH